MKQGAVVMMLVAVAAVSSSCGKAPDATVPAGTEAQAPAVPAGPTLKAVFGTTIAEKPIDHAIAKKNGDSEITMYIYSFKTAESWPDGAAYAADDFFIDVTIKDTVALQPGEYKGTQLSPTLHTKTTNYGFMAERGTIVITEIANGRIKGEFHLDDGSVKVSGPFEMPLE